MSIMGQRDVMQWTIGHLWDLSGQRHAGRGKGNQLDDIE